MPQDLDRRNFLVSIVGGTAALASWGKPSVDPVADSLSGARGLRALTPRQAKLLEAITEQLVPTDDFPGANSVGVVSYIDGVLAGPYGRFYERQYQHGLQMMDAYSVNTFKKISFHSIPPSRSTYCPSSNWQGPWRT
jgi:hypothetical protein